MNPKTKSLLEVNTAVFLFGFAGLLGKLIDLSPTLIVLGRVFFASIFLFFLLYFKKIKLNLIKKKEYIFLVGLGFLLALHWVAFFKSVKISSVTIALLTYSTFPIFVTFFEPYFFKEGFKFFDLFIAMISFLGIILIIPKFNLQNNITVGCLWGILSGLTFAILSIYNRYWVNKYSSLVVAFYQDISATFFLLPFLFLVDSEFNIKNIILLFILGIICTGAAHSLFIESLKNIKAHLASIISCFEPVYGIILAIIFLNEIPQFKTALGGILILFAAFLAIKNKRKF